MSLTATKGVPIECKQFDVTDGNDDDNCNRGVDCAGIGEFRFASNRARSNSNGRHTFIEPRLRWIASLHSYYLGLCYS